MIVKVLKTKEKEKVFKAARENKRHYIQGNHDKTVHLASHEKLYRLGNNGMTSVDKETLNIAFYIWGK